MRCHWHFIVNFYLVRFLVSTQTWRYHDNSSALSMILSQTPSHRPFAHLASSIYLLRPGAACHSLFVYCDHNSQTTAASTNLYFKTMRSTEHAGSCIKGRPCFRRKWFSKNKPESSALANTDAYRWVCLFRCFFPYRLLMTLLVFFSFHFFCEVGRGRLWVIPRFRVMGDEAASPPILLLSLSLLITQKVSSNGRAHNVLKCRCLDRILS